MQVFDILQKHYGISEEGIAISLKYFKTENLSEGDFFIKAGEVANKLAIVLEGLFRSWHTDDDGTEVTTAFHEPQTLLFCAESFNNHKPAEENIVALEDAKITCICSRDMQHLYKRVPSWKRVIMELSETKNRSLGERNFPDQSIEAKKRYDWFCKKHPNISKKAKPEHIASYLKINPAHILKQTSK